MGTHLRLRLGIMQVNLYFLLPKDFCFAKENLAILDNLQRAYISIKNDPALKDNKDLDKFLKNIEVVKSLIKVLEIKNYQNLIKKGKFTNKN